MHYRYISNGVLYFALTPILNLDINYNLQIKYIFGRKVTKKQMQKIIKYIPIKFIKNFLMNDFIDLIDIDTIKSLPKYIIDDNWIELNYLYNKALVENNFDMVKMLKEYIILVIQNFLGIINNIKVLINII